MLFVAHVHLLTNSLLRRRHSGVHGSPKSTVGSLHSGVSARTRCSHPGGTRWFQVEPRREVRGSPVESSAVGGSFSCFRRRKFPREGGDRGFLDPSSSGSTCGGAVEVVRGVFGAIVEEVGARRSGTHKSKVGQIERGSGICTPRMLRQTSKRRSLVCERSSPRQKEKHQRNVHA